ncbi:MAG: ornithine carbamoyltransferase [Lentisphaeria bacterium]|nr:ornithine carbamoyltransferase [Lentisphaeria bacterium]
MKKDLLTLQDITYDDLLEIFRRTKELKENRGNSDYRPLAGKSIGMIFAKSSTRTRVSFEVGVYELGGNPMYLDESRMQIGRGETVADTANVLSRYLHGIVIRTYSHEGVEELARVATIPVINALTDEYHPCQILADLYTILEYSGKIEGTKLVFYGDAQSNIANSLILAAKLTGLNLVFAAPEEFKPRADLIGDAKNITWESDPVKASEGADYMYSDVFVSMGFEDGREFRLEKLMPYQMTMDMIRVAKDNVKVLHCLPAHRGEEIAADVMDSEYSIVFDQAENRLHVQKAVLSLLVK